MNSKKACRRKVKYNKAQAKKQVELRKGRHNLVGSYYHCEHCGMYHVSKRSRNYISDRVWQAIKR